MTEMLMYWFIKVPNSTSFKEWFFLFHQWIVTHFNPTELIQSAKEAEGEGTLIIIITLFPLKSPLFPTLSVPPSRPFLTRWSPLALAPFLPSHQPSHASPPLSLPFSLPSFPLSPLWQSSSRTHTHTRTCGIHMQTHIIHRDTYMETSANKNVQIIFARQHTNTHGS